MSGNELHPVSAHARQTVQQLRTDILRPAGFAQGWGAMTAFEEQQEVRRVRRARRQALLLMLGSSVLSLAVLYGIWTLFARFV